MGKKEIKTNAMRILDRQKIAYEYETYDCDEFTDGIQVADMLGYEHCLVYKTLVTVGAGKDYFVFVIPVEAELDMKAAARAVGEKSVSMIPVREINRVTGYVRGGCTAIGMKKQYRTIEKRYLLRSRKESFGYSCLTNQKRFYTENYPKLAVLKGSIDEVIMMMIRGERL